MFTWLWNIKHRKLVEETKAMMRFYFFLRYEVGLKYADKLSARELKDLLRVIRQEKD